MSFTHTFTRSINDGASAVSKSEDVSSGQAIGLDETIPAPSTNLAVAFAFAVAKLKSIWKLSNLDLSVFTNAASTGAPQETIALKANKPFVWTLDDGYFAVPFAGNVTGLYVTKAAGTAAELKIRALVDPT